ncbi:phytanoyl-CoA dioxygenase family protein [Mycobacterium sp. 852002-30065_SCH5024008]|uniref:phytanoyl-CoA dioxygenase family protein n=1 Tax=Mycobacterium sp. 852002-30065_SCH5024008 TaxID=1834088 RepID=UPI0007FCF619|nr:phytanoyl-CoA dioxygenase family protein [Mycobacterium sp. 852002-30065_SCH5024008]OBB87737.1 phytanoyl-CoA dioxygenase [Mycobacterium sp. 852002-30065_SCH5024008]
MNIDDESVTTLEDLRGDLAQRYKRTASGGSSVDNAIVDADMAALDRDGYVIWKDLLTPEQCQQIREVVRPWLGHTGRNSFEGRHTQRIYSLLSRTRVCDEIVADPRVLAVLDRLLMPNYLLSALQAINIQPGEAAQLAHHDDGFYPVPRPREPLAAATIWAIDDFTADNGATVLYPGSHRWGKRRPGPDDQAMPVVMPAGSCVFFVGTLWHGGGANNTGHDRLAVTAQYCQPWLRPMEAFTLSISRDIARSVSDDLRRMLGYSIHPPFVGAVDGLHPLRLLEAARDS